MRYGVREFLMLVEIGMGDHFLHCDGKKKNPVSHYNEKVSHCFSE